MQIIMEFLPNNLWRLIIDGVPSKSTLYEMPLILPNYIAHTAYYGEEKVYAIASALPITIVDHTVKCYLNFTLD